jgi:hypothetical protein
MGTMEGFLLGQIMAPDNSINTGPAWRARAMREMARAQAAKEQAEKAENQLVAMEERAEEAEKQVANLTAALEKEHKRFLLERRKRAGYMKGWELRGKILMANCGYSVERMDAETIALAEKYADRLEAIEQEENAEIDKEAGF